MMSVSKAEDASSGEADLAYGFMPSADRARRLDQRMREDLATSLEYIFGELSSHLTLDQPALAAFLQRLQTSPTSPHTFTLYGDLVLAVDEDNLEKAEGLLSLLLSQPAERDELKITGLGDLPEYTAERLVRYVDSDPTIHFEIRRPDDSAVDLARAKILEGLRVLAKADPDLAAETRALIRDFILAAGTDDPAQPNYDAASSFLLWGAILVNVDRLGDLLDVVQMLGHESAHNLLFGLSSDDPLVTNDPNDRFSSPLRTDTRPMEGIYHATFVTGRMYRVLQRLLESGLLPAADEERARREMATKAAYFQTGLRTIREHAKLTPLGQVIIEGAAAAMPAPTSG